MSNFNGLKVLTLFEGFAVGGRTVDVDMTVRFFLMQDVGGGDDGHCFRWELSLDLKQSRVSATTIP